MSNLLDQQVDSFEEELSWQSRKLLLRTRVLQSQVDSARSSRDATLELSKSLQESNKCTDRDQLDRLMLKQEQMVEDRQSQLEQLNTKLANKKSQILARTKTLIRELWDIHPISEFPDRKGYSICDIHLPSSENLEGHDETMVSVAIGYVSHLLLLLSDILDVTLRFPLRYYGSKSLIYCSRRNQLFPLYIESFKSREWINFSYGMSLLNLNIVQIRTLYGLSTNEPDDTLANLHSLKIALTSEND